MPNLRTLHIEASCNEFQKFLSTRHTPPSSLQHMSLRLTRSSASSYSTVGLCRLAIGYQLVLGMLEVEAHIPEPPKPLVPGLYVPSPPTPSTLIEFGGIEELAALQHLSLHDCLLAGKVIAPSLQQLSLAWGVGMCRMEFTWKSFEACRALEDVTIQNAASISFIGCNASNLRSVKRIQLTSDVLMEDGAFQQLDAGGLEDFYINVKDSNGSCFVIKHLQTDPGLCHAVKLGRGELQCFIWRRGQRSWHSYLL